MAKILKQNIFKHQLLPGGPPPAAASKLNGSAGFNGPHGRGCVVGGAES